MISAWIDRLLDLFFPRHCVLCDRILPMMPQRNRKAVCPECLDALPFVREPFCMKCGKPLLLEQREYCADCRTRAHSYIAGRAVFTYRGSMKESMYRFKYSGRREYASFFAAEALRLRGKWLQSIRPDCIVPVPLYRQKQLKRGYNQAEDFAAALGQLSRARVETGMIRRVRNTAPMKGLSAADRKKNVKDAFAVDEKRLLRQDYKRILIVDDIYTTGSTMDAIAKALARYPGREVYFLCICTGQA